MTLVDDNDALMANRVKRHGQSSAGESHRAELETDLS